MNFFGLGKLIHYRTPEPTIVSRIRLPYAYACSDCDSINEGVTQGRCLSCGSLSVFHVRTLLDREQNKAAQRLKLRETIKETKVS